MTEDEFYNEDVAPTPNVALLRKAVEWVEAEAALPMTQRQWEQGSWFRPREVEATNFCGTACCVAGWVGLNSDEVQPQVEQDVYGNDRYTDRVEYPSGLVVHVSDYAQHALGLTDAQADRLFAGGNTATVIREVAEQIAGEPL